MKKLFIVGCSYTHWSDGDCFGESYPALIAKEYPNWHVYDAGEPGGANDSVYLRLQYLTEQYGTPDKVIVQWTHLGRTNVFLQELTHMPRVTEYITEGNYTFHTEQEHPSSSFAITPSTVDPVNRSGFHKLQLKKLSRSSKLRMQTLEQFYAWFLDSQTLYWNTQKEIDLVNAVYGKDNVLMYDWQYRHSPGTHLTMPDNWIGSLAYAFRKKNKFMSLGIDDAPHYAAEGHLEVYKWLEPHLNKLLT